MSPDWSAAAGASKRVDRKPILDRVRDLGPTALQLGLGAILFIWVSWSAICFPLFSYAFHEDFWEHAAVIREWSQDLRNPGNPIISSDVGSIRYTPVSLAHVAIGRVLDLDAIDTLEVVGVLNAGLLISAIFLFFGTYFRSAWAPATGLLVMLSGWGLGWRHSNEYQLRTLFYTSPYPSLTSFALSLIALAITIGMLRRRPLLPGSVLLLTLLVFTIITSHALTGAFALCAIGLIALTEHGASATDRTKVLLAAALGAGLVGLWPYYSVASLVFGVGTSEWFEGGRSFFNTTAGGSEPGGFEFMGFFYDPARVALGLGPALLGVPVLIRFALRRQHAFIVLGFVAMLVPYLANLIIPLATGGRFLLFAAFFLHLALVAYLLENAGSLRGLASRLAWTRANVATAAAATALVLSVLWNGGYAFAHFGYSYLYKEPVRTIMARILPHLGSDPIVMAPEKLAWPVPAFRGKVVSMLHPNPLVPDQQKRAEDVRRFFDESTSNIERRETLNRYGVTHVLLDAGAFSGTLEAFLASAGTPIVVNDHAVISLSESDPAHAPRRESGALAEPPPALLPEYATRGIPR